MLKPKIEQLPQSVVVAIEFVKVLFFVYCFLLSIDMMGMAFKQSGSGLKSLLNYATSNPFAGLIIGIVITSVIQSSSSTTSIVVAMVAGGTISLKNAIPIIMGANIGTTVTNTIVSFGYVGRRTEFERSFAAAIVHDIFNIYATIIFFPIELKYGIIYKSTIFLTTQFEGVGGLKIASPLKFIIHPISHPVTGFFHNHYILLLIFALICLFISMSQIVKNMKGIVMEKIELVLNQYLFKKAVVSLLFGIFFTALVQSSSIATSIMIPLVGAGILDVVKIFPYTMGANLGTTVTAALAAMSMGVPVAMSVAFSHMIFNIFGIAIFFPLSKIPVYTAKRIAKFVSFSKKHFLIFLILYIILHFVPVIFIIF